MIKFLKIMFRNFMSYGKVMTEFNFDLPGTTLIMGENGSGKTTILNALVYCLFNKPINDVNLDELINNTNKKDMFVAIEFEKNGVMYRIERGRKSPKAGFVRLFEDGKEKTTADIEARIEQIIGMDYSMFVRIVVISATQLPFLDLESKHQVAFIETLFNLTILSLKAAILKDLIKDTQSDIQIQQTKIAQLEQQYIRLQEQIAAAKSRAVNWVQNNERTITQLQTDLEKIAQVNFEEQQGFHKRLAELKQEVREVENEKRTLERTIKEQTTAVSKFTIELDSLQKSQCPYCKQPFINTKDRIEVCARGIDENKVQVTENQTYLQATESLFANLVKKQKEIEQQITVTNLDSLVKIRDQSQATKQKIDMLLEATNPHLEALGDLENTKLDPIEYTEINGFTKRLEHQQFLVKLLTKKDSFVRKAFLNRNLPFLNTRLQHYLGELGLPHKVEFTFDLDAKISQFGHEQSFGSLSNGQRARVNLSLALAFRDVLQALHTPINICMFDEVLDVGLSTIGVQAAAAMLKKKAKEEAISLLIISHRDEIDTAFDRTITIKLDSGFSKIV